MALLGHYLIRPRPLAIAVAFAIGSLSLAWTQELSRPAAGAPIAVTQNEAAAEAPFLREQRCHDEDDEQHGRETHGRCQP